MSMLDKYRVPKETPIDVQKLFSAAIDDEVVDAEIKSLFVSGDRNGDGVRGPDLIIGQEVSVITELF